jgi:predicted DNA-binding transcriptional regulator YafY
VKIDRLIGILSLLLQKDVVTAPYLAEKFEVSRRTILRDIEDLCKAGIPVITRQGANGGISLTETYKISRTPLTRSEMQDILAGLRGLDSVHETDRYRQFMERLQTGASDYMTADQSVLIDLSSWYKPALAPKIEQIRTAIDQNREIRFLYCSPKGETQRTAEPYYLIFQWSNWYVWGWCRMREDYRLFKLNRMDQLQITDAVFQKRSAPKPDLSHESVFPGGIRVKALFEPSCQWRLTESFGPGSFKKLPDGKLLFQADYTNKENLICWLLTFRDQVLLLEPQSIREEIREALKKTLQKYEE